MLNHTREIAILGCHIRSVPKYCYSIQKIQDIKQMLQWLPVLDNFGTG